MRVSLMRKLWKAGDVMSNVLKIRCVICEEVKDEEEFQNKKSYMGKDRRCKLCKNEADKQWRLNNSRHIQEYQRSRRYNITPEDFDNMLKKQGGTCANEACNYGLDGDQHKLFVDHCHETGTIRGLLCLWCNSAEGFLKGNPEVAQGLIDYMKKHNLKTK
jgi:hypothetical protein